MNKHADEQDTTLRISLDCKAVVGIGEFSRGGLSWTPQKALDHDFGPILKLTPFGILEPKTGASKLWFVKGPATADFMIDCVAEYLDQVKQTRPEINRLFINSDNGPECSGQRTQWLKRLVELSRDKNILIQLAYYPPYHSKYNPVERFWGVLEKHWCGELISSINKAIGLAKTMTYKKVSPIVSLVNKIYKKGIKLTKKEMVEVEQFIERKHGLEKYFFTISPGSILG